MPKDSLTLRLSGGAKAAPMARNALAQLDADIDTPQMETLRLLVTELVANSVKHAHADTMELKVLVVDATVLVEVTDEGPGFDPLPRSARGSDAGWGLYLVERLAHRWGVHREGGNTRVWFELRRA